jgi:hypothetical protein
MISDTFVPRGYTALPDAVKQADREWFRDELAELELTPEEVGILQEHDRASRHISAVRAAAVNVHGPRIPSPSEATKQAAVETPEIQRLQAKQSRSLKALPQIPNRAWLRFRQQLYEGTISAFVITSQGEIEQLDQRLWLREGFAQAHVTGSVVHPEHGLARVVVRQDELDSLKAPAETSPPIGRFESLKEPVSAAFQPAPSASGDARPLRQQRKRGPVSLERHDGPLVDELDALIQSEGISQFEAAMRLAPKAKGGGTLQSKAQRLIKRHRAKHGVIR